MTTLERAKAAFALTVIALGAIVVVAMLSGRTDLAELAFSPWGLLDFALSYVLAPAAVRVLTYRRVKGRNDDV